MGAMTEVKKQTELEELALLKAQEEDMVEALIRRYRPLVYATARRLCPSLAKDEDLLQCGMIGLWRAAERWDEQRPFSPLAKQCIRGEMVNHLRYLSRQIPARSLPDDRLCPAVEQDFSRVELEADVARKFPSGGPDRQILTLILAGADLPQAALRAGQTPRAARRRLKRKLPRLLGPKDHVR